MKLPSLDSKSEEERISAILVPDEPYEAEYNEYVELPEATKEMLMRYHKFLLDKLPVGLKLTGYDTMGHFSWEESFAWNGGSEKEYKALKQQFASCDEKFKFLRLTQWHEEFGLIAEVKRLTDQKIFLIPLVDLETCQPDTKESQLLKDYASWFVNFGPEGM